MAIDNSLYDALQNTHIKMTDYFNKVQLGREHSFMIVKHEELAELLENLDIEAIEEQWPDIDSLHKELNLIKEDVLEVQKYLIHNADSTVMAENTVSRLDEVFSKISKIIGN